MEQLLNKITELVEEFNNSEFNFKIDLHLVKQMKSKTKSKFLELSDIMTLVCNESGLTSEQIRMKSKDAYIMRPRQICHYLAVKRSNYNNKDIGAYFGNKDRNTVDWSYNTITNYLKCDKEFISRWGDFLNSYHS